MEIIQPFIGKYDGSSIFLNHGKYGPYLKWGDNKLYSVPKCFQTPKFNLEAAIKIIDFKNKWSENKNNELVTGPEDEESNANRIKNNKQLQHMKKLII